LSRIEELAPDVFVLSDIEPVNGRSWLPPGSKGYEPFNKYLFLSDGHALLLDTGPLAHRHSVLESLGRLVGSRRLTVMVSRSEPECISNVGAVVDRFPDLRVIGIMKNLPLLGLVDMRQPPRDGLTAERIVLRKSLAEYGFPNLTPVEPLIKTLSTIWIDDSASGMLFTSDFFSADLLSAPDMPVIRRDMSGLAAPDTLRRHILTKFDWLEHAWPGELADAWDRFFAGTHPAALAPGLGRIQSGPALVQRAIADYREAVFGPRPAAAAS
jgi:hypothetical protein